LAESNAAQVRRIRQVLDALSLDIATPDEARTMLQLKGRDNVVFGTRISGAEMNAGT
jgi:hypothetical protein